MTETELEPVRSGVLSRGLYYLAPRAAVLAFIGVGALAAVKTITAVILPGVCFVCVCGQPKEEVRRARWGEARWDDGRWTEAR